MKLSLLLALLSTSVFAGTEVVYERTQSNLDFSMNAKIAVQKGEAKLSLSRVTLGCHFGARCTRYENVTVQGLDYDKNKETVSYKGTLCGTARPHFISYAGRTGKYITQFHSNGNCKVNVANSNKKYKVSISH